MAGLADEVVVVGASSRAVVLVSRVSLVAISALVVVVANDMMNSAESDRNGEKW